MAKKKILRIISLTLCICSLLAITVFAVDTTLLATTSEVTTTSANKTLVNPVFKKVCENDKLELYVDEETMNIQVKNKATGYVWKSADTNSAKKLNKNFTRMANSGIVVGYKSAGATETEKIVPAMENSTIKLTSKADGFSAKVKFTKFGFNFKVDLTLKDDGIKVEVPFESIEETKSDKYLLYYVTLFPFLGSSQDQADGEFFIPDGIGATIDLSIPTDATKSFSAKFFGEDIGFLGENGLKKYAENSTPPEQLTMPVYGITYESKNSCMTYIEKGAEFAELNANLSGNLTDYNFMNSAYYYRGDYYQQVDKKGSGTSKNQEKLNKFDISQNIYFINGENMGYSDMAVKFRNELLENKTITKLENDATTLGIEFLMADNEESMLGKKPLVMTTADYSNKIINELYEKGIKNISTTYTGYSNGGLTGSYPAHLGFEDATGSKSSYKELFKNAKDKNIDTYLSADFVKAYSEAEGYSKKDISRTIGQQFVSVGGENFDRFNILKPSVTKSLFEKQLDSFTELGVSGLNMNSIGNILYSSYIDNPSNRTETISAYDKVLENNKLKYSLPNPNMYAWKYASQITSVPLTSSDYLICTDTVPFMQIVLKGSIKMFTIPQNLNQHGKVDILHMIDYGVNPSYVITENDPSILYRSESKDVFTSKYDLWKEDMKTTFEEVSTVLNKVDGAFINSRKEIANDVYLITYSNDVKITVNYSADEYVDGSTKIPAMSYSVN